MSKGNYKIKILIAISAVIFVLISGFVIWAEITPEPMSEAIAALNSDSAVEVQTSKRLVFHPVNSPYSTAFIIYPGGKVNPISYAPAAHNIAANGFLTIIEPMPLNLAVFGINRASSIIESHPEIQTWAIGGHSLGGTMAAQFAASNPSEISGLVLWSSYPASSSNLSGSGISALTIHGTNDGLVSKSQIDKSLKLLPTSTIRVEIEGGNHAQFGWYGKQPGDNDATISRESQQQQIIDATTDFLKNLQNKHVSAELYNTAGLR